MEKITVSKFDPFYIAASIAVLFLVFFILFYIFFAEQGGFYFEQDKIFYYILIFVVSNCFVWHKLKRVSITEKDVTFKNLVTRKVRKIKFDDVEKILYETSTAKGGAPLVSMLVRQDTRKKHLGLKTFKGRVFWFNDNMYENFDEIHKAIIENMNKKSVS